MNNKDIKDYDVAVVGGGASALWFTSFLLSSINSNSKSLRIVVIDSNSAPGKKLLMTGNGRCNITNTAIDLGLYNTDDRDKLENIINDFNADDTIKYLNNKLGILTLNKGELVYPQTLKSLTINNGLINSIKSGGGVFMLDNRIIKIEYDINERQYILFSPESIIKTKFVVLAFGGASYPKTGSDGKSFNLLKDFIRREDVVNLLPSLVQLKTKNSFPAKISGTRTSSKLTLSDSSGVITSDNGELLFTDYGISGILVMQLSGVINRYFDLNRKYPQLYCDLLPEYSAAQIIGYIEGLKDNLIANNKVCDALQGIILPEIIRAVLEESDLKNLLNLKLKDLTDNDIKRIVNLLKSVNIRISSTLGFDNAQVTSGGIKLSSLTDNLELKENSNMFIIGEAINVDGPCGGYNLQWAWSSAVKAARGVYDRL